MHKFLSGSLACAPVLLVSGCGSSNSVSQVQTTSGCSITGQNQQILAIVQSWYYWNQYLPGNVDPAAYSDTTSFLDSLLYQPLDRFSYITTQAANQAFYSARQHVGIGISEDIVNGNCGASAAAVERPIARAGALRPSPQKYSGQNLVNAH